MFLMLGSCSLAAQPDDVIWVTSAGTSTVSRYQRVGSTPRQFSARVPPWRPVGVSLRANGDAWVAVQQGGCLYGLDRNGKPIGTIPVPGRPTTTAIDAQGDIWCGNLTGNAFKFSPSGARLLHLTPPGAIEIQHIACDSRGDAWIGDNKGVIWKVDRTGQIVMTLIDGYDVVAVDHDDNLYCTGLVNATLRKYTSGGVPLWTVPVYAVNHAELAVDGNGDVWMAAQSNFVLKYSTRSRTLQTFRIYSYALSVAVDGVGDVWVADPYSQEMAVFRSDGTLLRKVPVDASPIPIGDPTGFKRAVFVDPFGDVDGDGHPNNAEAVARSNPFDPASVPCRLTVGGDQRVGGRATFLYEDLGGNGGLIYAAASSWSRAGSIPVGPKRRIGLVPDALFFLSLKAPHIFQNYIGKLDGNGRGFPAIAVPSISQLAGTTIHTVAITLDPSAHRGVRTVSPPIGFKVKP